MEKSFLLNTQKLVLHIALELVHFDESLIQAHMSATIDGAIGTIHQETSTAKIFIEPSTRCLEILWLGKVNYDDYIKTMMEAKRLVDEEGYGHAIINRLQLDEISPDSALWLKKEFIKVHLKPIINKLQKVATVESKSTFSRFYSNSLTLATKVIYPNLSIKSFGTKAEALSWIGS